MSDCDHANTHPARCDDCKRPWCSLCATYHDFPTNGYQCGVRLRGIIADLRARIAELKRATMPTEDT